MGIAQRIHDTIEDWQAEWKDRIRGWSLRVIVEGITKLFEDLEEEARPSAEDFLSRFPMHPEVKKELEVFLAKKSPVHIPAFAMMAIGVVIGSIIGTFMGWAAPIAKWTSYQGEKVIKSYRLDPFSWISAFRREYEKFDDIKDDLKDQGFNDERIEALKFATLFYPSPRDLIGFLAHEVYEDDMAARYGLDMDFDEVAKHLDKFKKAGMEEPQVKEFWRDHWEHTSYMQMVELLHRGLLTETGQPPPTTKEGWEARDAEGTEILRDWYKLVEMADFWRDKLTAMVWNVLTRVDTRRMWDMRSISEERLYSIYHQQGYHGEDLEDMVKWTKIFTDFPVKMAHFTNGWITEQDIRDWLASLDIPPERIEDFIREKTKPASAERVKGEKNLTMALIVEGVKKGVISEAEGIELLTDLGYSSDEAEYIIRVRVETVTGSPENMEQFRDITQKYRKAVGIPAKPVSEALKKAADEVVRVTKEVEDLRRLAKEEREKLADDEILPKEATARFDEVTLALHRGEAELFRVKTDYDSLRAEWHQQEAK